MHWGHEQWGVVATIDPVDANGANSSSDVIDMSKWHEVVAILLTGAMHDSATLDLAAHESAHPDGSSPSALAGKALSQISGNGGDNKQFLIAVKAEEMSAGKRYLRFTQANSAHAQLMALVVLGRPRYAPATDDDLLSVTQIVA
jgi:hypothetical protein